jgi:glyoxylase-like metal-dependent hydrolase (beta-lactamase superfamily II)
MEKYLKKFFNRKNYHIDVAYHVGTYENSIHFVFDEDSDQCAVIDPAWEGEKIIRYAEDKGYHISKILLTHWHNDHVNAVDYIVEKTGCQVISGVNDIENIPTSNPINGCRGGDIVYVGCVRIQVIDTPGHTAGGVSFLLDEDIIVGDTLFVDGCGRVDLLGGSSGDLFNTMGKLKIIPNNVTLHCGHDYGPTIAPTMGEQKDSNRFLMAKNIAEFNKLLTFVGRWKI